MNPQNEQNTNPDGLVGNEVNSATPQVDAPVTPEVTDPAVATTDPIATPVESTPDSNTFSVNPVGTASVEEPMPTGDIAVNGKKSKKGLLVVVIILILALIGGGVAFMLWNNSDNKIISDAWHNLFKEKNQIALTISAEVTPENGPKTSFTITADGIGQDSDGKFNVGVTANTAGVSFVANAEAIAKDGDIYVKTDLGQLSTLLGEAAQYDGQWIKISKEFVEQIISSYGAEIDDESQVCVANAVESLSNSTTAQDEFLKVLTDSNVYKYQRASTDGDIITYNLDLSYNKADSKALSESLKNTTIYKDLSACSGFSESIDAVEDETTVEIPSNQPAVTFTVNSKTRQFSGLGITVTNDDGSIVTIGLTGSTSLQNSVNISAPEGDTIDISNVFMALSGGLGDYGYNNDYGYDYDSLQDIETSTGI